MATAAVVAGVPEVSLKERIRRVSELDLEPIKYKLVHEEGWTIDRADRVEVEYKKFLVLVLKNRVTRAVQSIVPTKEIDQFWHNHILDTIKYASDCEFYFGFFLHHFPYLGLRGPEDAQALQDQFRESQAYYKAEFGATEATGASAICTSCGTSNCAPTPSCGSDPSPTVNDHARPVVSREEREGSQAEFEAEFGADVSMVDASSICASGCGATPSCSSSSCSGDPSPSIDQHVRPVLARV